MRNLRLIFWALVPLALLGLGLTLVMRGGGEQAPVRETGEALVGGSFALVDQTGARRTSEEFRGGYMLVYFGYTFCPDVCPLDLHRASVALDLFEEQGGAIGNIQPIFISIDPARDTPAVLAEYLQNFHERFIGLTGTDSEIAEAAGAYRVYYQRGEDYGPDGYLMDHSNIIYLMGPDGKYVTHFTSEDTAPTIAGSLLSHVGRR